jgi:DNA-binding NtrC family response regulator
MGQLKHILVVDDNGDVRDVIVDTLQEQHFRVSTASSGSTMRDFLDTGDMVDCIILDVLMPGEASASLVLHLKERGIPLVMISGNPEAVKLAEDNGLQLLPKPFRSHELYGAVNMALASSEFGQRLQGDGSNAEKKASGSDNVRLVRVLPGRSRHLGSIWKELAPGFLREVPRVPSAQPPG